MFMSNKCHLLLYKAESLIILYKAEKLSVCHVEVRMKVINTSLTISNLKLCVLRNNYTYIQQVLQYK